MKTRTSSMIRNQDQDGFTLVETLISLIILGVASALLVQSISLASSEIAASNRQQAAEILAVSLLAENEVSGSNEGSDPVSGLYWQIERKYRERVAEGTNRKGFEFVRIAILPRKGADPLLVLKSAMMSGSAQ
jgi:prepilin-type N-terminal cleavage/methylation domain-containing protein